MQTSKLMTSEKQYIELFETQRDVLTANSCAPMNDVRDAAFAHFKRLGFPSRKVERYKYTDVQKAFAPDYGVNLRRIQFPVNPYEAFRCNVPNLSTQLYFTVNDAFYEKNKDAASLPEGVRIGSICQLAGELPVIARHYGRLATTENDGITALNTMLAQDGIVIYLPEGTQMARPVQVVNLLRSDVNLMANRRVLIIAEANVQAALLFCDHAIDDRAFLSTQVTEVYAGTNSRIELYNLEETHIQNTTFNNLYVHQEAGSHVTLGALTLHNGLTRNQVEVTLAGQNAETIAYGCVVADKQQHVDNNLVIDHQTESCQSNMLYKYVLDGQATGAWAGKVLVREGAQHTDSQQTNANICISEQAHMYTQPMLEIYADDVKCNHGSTVGQLDEKALFYMRQRGIDEAEARLLLQHAFVNDVIRRITLEPLRERLSHLVEMRFRGELGKCKGCTICR